MTEIDTSDENVEAYAQGFDGTGPRVAALLRALAQERKDAVKLDRDFSASYLRIRKILDAWKTPHAPTHEQVWAHTEACAQAAIDRATAAETALAAARAMLAEADAKTVNLRTALGHVVARGKSVNWWLFKPDIDFIEQTALKAIFDSHAARASEE